MNRGSDPTPPRPRSEEAASGDGRSEEYAKRLGDECLTALTIAENALRILAEMPDSKVQLAFPDRWPGGRLPDEESKLLTAEQCADGQSLVGFIYQVFQGSEARHQRPFHELARIVDRMRRRQGKPPATPKSSEIIRGAIARSKWWFEDLIGSSPNDTARRWADGAAGWILDDLLRHRRAIGLGATTKKTALAAVRSRLGQLKLRRRDGGLDSHFLETLTLECLVALGKTRSEAKDDLSAIRHEETKRVRGKS